MKIYEINRDQLFHSKNLDESLLKVNILNQHKYVAYANQLIYTNENPLLGYKFLVKLYESQHDDQRLLLSLDAAIQVAQDEFKDNRELRDAHVSAFWIKKIYLLAREKAYPIAQLLSEIEQGFTTFISHDESQFLDLAEIAYSHQDLPLAKKILLKLIRGINDDVLVQRGLIHWYHRFSKILGEGYVDADMQYYQLMIERNYADELNIAADHYYHTAVRYIESRPSAYDGFHFAGTYLYENGQYPDAIAYFKQAIQRKVDVLTWRRLIESEYQIQQPIAADVPLFQLNSPHQLYAAAVNLYEFIQDHVAVADQPFFNRLHAEIYRQTYRAFRAYFEQNQYESDRSCDYKQFAMCCNDYAIALTKLGHYQEAVRVSSEGLQYSGGMELHFSRIDALLKEANYENADRALKQYFYHYNAESVPYYLHQLQLSNQVLVDYHQHRRNQLQLKANVLLLGLYDHSLEQDANIKDADYRKLNTAKTNLENTIYDLIEEDNIDERIKYFEDILQDYPNESQPYYMLMQEYNEVGQYEKMKQAAKHYLRNKKAFLLSNTDKNKSRYLILKSHFLLNEYVEGAAYFERYEHDIQHSMDEEDRVQLLGYMVQIYAKLNQVERVAGFVNYIDQVYETNQWDYDDLIERIYLAQAEMLYQKGDLKPAHQLLKKVLVYVDHDPIAIEFKREWKKPGLLSLVF